MNAVRTNVHLIARSAAMAVLTAAALAKPTEAQWPLNPLPTVQIGVLDGPQEYILGYVEALEVDDRGNVYVLEGWPSPRLLKYGPNGRYLEQIGREGSGPGEYRTPNDIAIDGSGRLHIVDGVNGRISSFDIKGERAVHIDIRQPLVQSAASICVAGDRRFLLTPRTDKLIHEIGPSGEVIRSFGDPVQPDREIANATVGWEHVVRQLLSRGSIRCDASSGRILLVTPHGDVRMYTMTGTLVWSRRLDNFLRGVIRSIAQGGCCFFGPDPTTMTSHSAGAGIFDGEWLRIPLQEFGQGRGPDVVRRYEIRVLRAADGSEVRAEASPAMIAGAKHGTVFGWRREPYPTVLVWR